MKTLYTVFTLVYVFTGKSIHIMSSPTEETMFKEKTQKVLKLVNFYAKILKSHSKAAIEGCSAKKFFLNSRQNP